VSLRGANRCDDCGKFKRWDDLEFYQYCPYPTALEPAEGAHCKGGCQATTPTPSSDPQEAEASQEASFLTREGSNKQEDK
jgi:hypothetical protein